MPLHLLLGNERSPN
uniref:Uncharacterized protein n=1 Tax=Arundo donax TaxID=35708 RepID=A0A0A8ZVV2_ARUDO